MHNMLSIFWQIPISAQIFEPSTSDTKCDGLPLAHPPMHYKTCFFFSRPRFLGGGGCNDAFSAFAFLTFLLTLLDVILGERFPAGALPKSLYPDYFITLAHICHRPFTLSLF